MHGNRRYLSRGLVLLALLTISIGPARSQNMLADPGFDDPTFSAWDEYPIGYWDPLDLDGDPDSGSAALPRESPGGRHDRRPSRCLSALLEEPEEGVALCAFMTSNCSIGVMGTTIVTFNTGQTATDPSCQWSCTATSTLPGGSGGVP